MPAVPQLNPQRRLKVEIVSYKRQRIVEEGSRLFYERGYAASTCDLLAERLHVTKPFLYSYFRDKADILAEICETGVRESLAELERVVREPGSPAEELAAVIERVARIIIARQEYIVVYQREMKNLRREDAQRVLRLRQEFDQRIAEIVRAGVADGSFAVADPAMASVWIGGLLAWLASWYTPTGRRSADEVVDEAVKATMLLVGRPCMS